MVNTDKLWQAITDYVKWNPVLSLLSQSPRSQLFEVSIIDDDYLLLKFQNSKNALKLEKSRFISAYSMLNENRGQWIKIGASRVNTKPETLERRIKSDYDGKMNGLSTAPWIAAILVGAFNNIGFNGLKKGQAIRLL